MHVPSQKTLASIAKESKLTIKWIRKSLRLFVSISKLLFINFFISFDYKLDVLSLEFEPT